MFIRLQVLCLELDAKFRRRENDGIQRAYNCFVFQSKDRCKCDYIDGNKQEIEPDLLNHPSSFYGRHLLRGFETRSKFS